MGIDFKEADGTAHLPFENELFDMIINRHGDYIPVEIFRLLKNDGMFITEQIGAENDRELVQLLLPQENKLPYPKQYLDKAVAKLKNAGLSIIKSQETFRPIRFLM